MDIPPELVEQLARGNGALFIGAGLSIGAGLPGWSKLLTPLANSIRLPPNLRTDLLKVAQHYQNKRGRQALISHVIEQTDTTGKELTDNHHRLVSLGVRTWVTTNYDDLLEQMLREAGERFTKVVRDQDLPYTSADRVTLVKLHGDREQPNTIIITQQDYHTYFHRFPRVKDKLTGLLLEKTFFFVGYSINDPDFNQIHAEIEFDLQQHQRMAYAVLFDADEFTVSDLRSRNIHVINIPVGEQANYSERLGELLYELIRQVDKARGLPDVGLEPPEDEMLTVDETAYREWLRSDTDAIDIRGIGASGSHEVHHFPLLKLYTELHACKGRAESDLDRGLDRVDKRTRLIDAVMSARCTIIFGDPGSGKTTFLRYLARTYVEDTSKPLPFSLDATDLYNHVTSLSRSQRTKQYWCYLVNYLLKQSDISDWGFEGPWLLEQFQQGQALMLLDRLDELPGDAERVQIVQIIDSAVKEWPKCRWVLTSRHGVLRGRARPQNFSTVEIDTLGDEEILAFIDSWVNLLSHRAPPEMDELLQSEYINTLWFAIHDRKDVRLLARNPCMLTAIAVVHWNEGRKLPEGRADLYEAIITWLIKAHEPELPNRPDKMVIRKCHQLLALAMFQDTQGRQTEVGFRWAAEKIATYLAKKRGEEQKEKEEKIEAAEQFLFQEEFYTGIIVRRGEGNLKFWHLSFQEYLAACEIASRLDTDADTGWWALIKDNLDNPNWSEVLRFVPVRLFELGDDRVDLFVKRILGTRKDDSLAETARVVGFLGPILHDLAVFEYSVNHVDEYVLALEQVMDIFEKQSLELDLQTRYNTAVALGKGRDPRFLKPEENWIHIPGGMLWVGAQNKDPSQPNYDEFAEEHEQPVHQVYTASFEIGKYPVTVQEYARFVEDGGYEDESLWDPAGWEWRVSSDYNSSPDRWDEQLAYPNCPVVYVGWYEAQAYCNWLTRRDNEMNYRLLNQLGQFHLSWLLTHRDNEMNYRLPTEAEWEYVARRGQETYSRYCFGNVPRRELGDKINWEHSGLGCLAPVGLFPLDTSYDGVKDMNGNILEWVQDPGDSRYTPDPTQASLISRQPSNHRCLRGGSWHGLDCHSANRTCYLPENRYSEVGFRVVRVRKPIPPKTKRPAKEYRATLADVYAKYKYANTIYSLQDADRKLSSYTDRFPGISTQIISKLFPRAVVEENRPFDRLPCVLGKAPPTKLEFNLLYQDTRLKLAVEEKLGPDQEPSRYEQDAQDLMEIVSILLSTTGIHEHALWQDLTDNDLDALIHMVLNRYDPDRIQRLLSTGRQRNKLALDGLPFLSRLSLEELIEQQVFGAAVWGHDQVPSTDTLISAKGSLEINDIELFKQDVLSKECHMLFFFRENGDLVWELALILRLLKENPQLHITGVVNTEVVAHNANVETLRWCLKQPAFQRIEASDRFVVFEEDNLRSSIDPGYCSKALLDRLQGAAVALVRGVAFFETMQKLSVDTYHAFVVHNTDSQICTGFKKSSGVFVRIPRGMIGYRYGEQTLQEIYPILKSL